MSIFLHKLHQTAAMPAKCQYNRDCNMTRTASTALQELKSSMETYFESKKNNSNETVEENSNLCKLIALWKLSIPQPTQDDVLLSFKVNTRLEEAYYFFASYLYSNESNPNPNETVIVGRCGQLHITNTSATILSSFKAMS